MDRACHACVHLNRAVKFHGHQFCTSLTAQVACNEQVHLATVAYTGSQSCRGVMKYGGKIQLNAHVDHVLMERGRATGVVLKSGQVIKTRKVAPLHV